MWHLFRKCDVSALRDELTALRSDFKALELEWVNTYQKLRKAVGRIVKAEAIEQNKTGAETGEGQPGLPLENGSLASLSEHQKQVQQQILRHRARM